MRIIGARALMAYPDRNSTFLQTARDIATYRRYWASRFGTAPFLPMSRAEMDLLGWDSCDIIVVTGDAYVDHPSFGMAIIGRALGGAGFSCRHHRAVGLGATPQAFA